MGEIIYLAVERAKRRDKPQLSQNGLNRLLNDLLKGSVHSPHDPVTHKPILDWPDGAA